MSVSRFESVLASPFGRFVAFKRACGADYVSGAKLLVQFDRFLIRQRTERVDRDVLLDFVASVSHLTPRAKDNLFCVVWQALDHARRHGEPMHDLPSRPSIKPQPPRRAYVLSDDEIGRLLRAALELRGGAALRPYTYSTLFALMRTTGLRLGEALALEVRDVEARDELLVVREGKFRKSRLLPITSSTLVGLQIYLEQRQRLRYPRSLDGPLFVLSRRGRPNLWTIESTFNRLVKRLGIRDRKGRRPRVHDLRHAFASHRVIAWHNERRDVNQLLSLLSTYMGHVNIASTQVYLQPSLQLLAAAGERFESLCAPRPRRRGKAGA